jgi:hypothetical protein
MADPAFAGARVLDVRRGNRRDGPHQPVNPASEPLFVASILLIIGSGATFPWEPRWQAAFNLVPLIGLLISVPHTSDGFNGFRWVAIAAALVFSQIANLTFTRFRESLQRHLAELRASHERLRAEIGQRELTTRELAESVVMLARSSTPPST